MRLNVSEQETCNSPTQTNAAPTPTMADIKLAVAVVAGIPIAAMTAQSRRHAWARARQAAIYLCCTMTGSSLTKVSHAFGRRHHTTILWAKRKYAKLQETDTDIALMLQRAREMVMARVMARLASQQPVVAHSTEQQEIAT